MKKLLLIGVCFILSFTISACGSQKSPVKETNNDPPKVEGNTSEGQNQQQKEMSVSLTTIDGWGKVEGSTAIIQYLKNGNSVIVTRDIMPSEAQTPEKFIGYVKEKLGNTFGGVTLGDAAEIGISDPNKHLLVYTYDVKVGGNPIKMKAWTAYIFHEGKAYTLTCGALSSNFPEVEKDFRTFIESFKLVPKE